MKEILGRKLGMTCIFAESGEAIPVTVIEAGPCPVLARMTADKNGYDAYQVGFGSRRKSRLNKPMAGIFSKAGVDPAHYIREVRYDEGELEVGSELKVTVFKEGELVDVTGTSRGLGFAGVMKRHGFSGGNKTHGQSDRWRAPGSIGQSSYPSRVFKGQRMPGRMGHDTVTTLALRVVKIIENENLMLIKGAVPGNKGSLVKVRRSNRSRNGL